MFRRIAIRVSAFGLAGLTTLSVLMALDLLAAQQHAASALAGRAPLTQRAAAAAKAVPAPVMQQVIVVAPRAARG
ncbi:MAG: hypothetical protein ACRC2B_09800 [Rubrivivax sp.]